MEIWLKEISINDGNEYFNLLNELASYYDVYAKPIPEQIDYEDYKYFIEARVNLSKDNDFSSKRVPTTTYWVMNGTEPIGYATLKHRVELNEVGGHFGCCLKKEYQNKGIGKIVSEQLSKKAYEEYGINKVIYTAKNENKQSQHSLEKIGATFVCEKEGYLFYEVDLTKKYGSKRR